MKPGTATDPVSPSTMSNSIHSEPRVYDLAFSYRKAGLSVVGCSAGFAAADPSGELARTTTLTSSSGLHPCIAFAKSRLQ